MSKIVRRLGWVMLVAVALVLGSSVPTTTTEAGTCYGQRIDYYQTAACQVLATSKVVCPGYPDQYLIPLGGTFSPTPYSVSRQVTCPCPSSGGGGTGNTGPSLVPVGPD